MSLTKLHNRMITGASANIKDFGAVGDGVTDDSVAIQAAFDSGSLNVLVPEGTYIISVALVPVANQTIIFVFEKPIFLPFVFYFYLGVFCFVV